MKHITKIPRDNTFTIMTKILCHFCVCASVLLSQVNCGYNSLVSLDEEISASWSEVLNQYKRRADLIPNLVKVVKGYAKHEKETLIQVVEARAKATSIQAGPELLKNAAAFRSFQKAQGALSSALSRLMLVVERYPNLKANTQFTNLQASLEGTENRLTVARNRYIQNIKKYNTKVRSFPSNITAKLFNFEKKPQFTVEEEEQIKKTPEVNFE